MKKGIIGKLEQKIVNTLMAIIIGTGMVVIANTYHVPHNITATIQNVRVCDYQGKKINVIETDEGRFRNEDSLVYRKHNSQQLQSMAKKLVGKKVEIRNYGRHGPLEFKEYPKRNILDIKYFDK